ncbi:PHP domain-containing protein [Spirochaetota bacterium]
MKKIDLHTHTTASDGIYAPEKLIDMAIENNLIALAITDHDAIDGLQSAVNYAQNINIKFIPGIEFSVDYDMGSFHLVGLGIKPDDEKIIARTKKLQHSRDTRAKRIIEDLEKHDIHITIEEVLEESSSGSIGRPHLARVMVKHGYAKNIKDVFKDYLVKGKPGYAKKDRVKLDEAISLIRDSGGVPIIAHPISLGFKDFSDFENILKDFIDMGLAGIEVFSSMHKNNEVKEFQNIAKKYDLIISGGSDFHGDKNEIIGNYAENEPIPIDILYGLEKHLR